MLFFLGDYYRLSLILISRAIERKLRDVHELPSDTVTNLLEEVVENNLLIDGESEV